MHSELYLFLQAEIAGKEKKALLYSLQSTEVEQRGFIKY